jgi:DNA-binding IclR family transcriptional regulator
MADKINRAGMDLTGDAEGDGASAGSSESEAAAQREAGSSLTRMLQLLDLITLSRPAITLDDVTRELGHTMSTSYRYVRELTNAGLLAAIGSGRYALGPRIFELDLLARRTDPVLVASSPAMPELLDLVAEGVVLVCELRGSKAVYVLAEKKPETLDIHPQRGTTMELFRGSASKAILAHLPNRRLSRIFSEFREEVAMAGLGTDWPSFIKNIAGLRRQPYILSLGEFDPRNFALSAPIFYDNGNIAGSVNIIMRLKHYNEALVASLAPSLIEAAKGINARLGQLAASHPAFPAPSA